MSDTPQGRSNKSNYKIVLLGEGRVGKTSMVLRYVNNTFSEKQQVRMWRGVSLIIDCATNTHHHALTDAECVHRRRYRPPFSAGDCPWERHK